jgi:hypothetical protein
MPVDIYKIKRRRIPEDSNFLNYRSYDLTSHIYLIFQNLLQKEEMVLHTYKRYAWPYQSSGAILICGG